MDWCAFDPGQPFQTIVLNCFNGRTDPILRMIFKKQRFSRNNSSRITRFIRFYF